MASQSVRATIKQVKPILSIDKAEARKRVLNLYKAWYRQLPYIGTSNCSTLTSILFKHLTFSVKQYDIPKSTEQLRTKLREEFTKHPDYADIRVIDMLVIKVPYKQKHVRLTRFKTNTIFTGPNGIKRSSKYLETKRTHYGIL